jgi:hypothetical protein
MSGVQNYHHKYDTCTAAMAATAVLCAAVCSIIPTQQHISNAPGRVLLRNCHPLLLLLLLLLVAPPSRGSTATSAALPCLNL